MRAVVGSVAIEVGDIFDESDPRENNFLYRLANDLHLSTREGTVREWLLLQPGELYPAQKAEETARILRERKYLADAEVAPTSYDPVTNSVDLRVWVRDVGTLEPGVGFGRSGGANKSRLRIAEENLFGLGQKVALALKSDQDRSGVSLQFIDPNLFHSFWSLATDYSDNSDYDSYGVQGGVSKGLVNGWTRRWLARYRYDRARFTPTTGNGLSTLELPEDRLLSYPWVGIELIEDDFTTTHNRDQIGRTEDLFLGRQLRASVGWASPAFGSDRSAGIFSLGASI